MYQFTSEFEQRGMAKKQKTFFFSVISVLCVIIIILSVIIAFKSTISSDSRQVIRQRIVNCISEARDSLNAISSSVDSDTASRVGNIKGYVYTVKHLNRVNMALNNQESLIDEQIIELLENDLQQFDSLLKTSGSTMTVRSNLSEHLEQLKASIQN